jgi:hypothetical protein
LDHSQRLTYRKFPRQREFSLRKNKSEIPKGFVETKKKPVASCLFGFKDNSTLVSYVPRKGKVVLLLSTMHHDKKIDEATGVARKLEIISFYNTTKEGVDVVDQMCSNYDVSRNSRRWPLMFSFKR